MRRSLAIVLSLIAVPAAAAAQDELAEERAETPEPVGEQTATERTGTRLRDYYDAMAERRLIAPETGSASRLREMVRRGEDLYLDDRFEEAQRVLYEVVESPRFRDFDLLEEYRQAEFMLAGTLQRLGALRSAWRYLERILDRGVEDPYFGPAYRRAVDVALEGADLAAAIERLQGVVPEEVLPPDARNELLYLQGRERYDAQDWTGAVAHFEQVGRRSRFYANARYLQGVLAAQAGRLEDAEDQFCAIATTPDTDQYTFFVDQRYFEIRDLTWMALGRVAHEGRRPEDAFYYYFQVPQDSDRVARALFEAAWAMYEGDDHDTAIDLLDQLEARFPDSPFVHEATLLRGYIQLARCEFEEADRLFRAFQTRFTPVVHEIDRILSSPARQGRLFEELLAAERQRADRPEAEEGEAPGEGGEAPVDVRALLMSLLQVDPSFYRLYAEVRTLDAEAARAGRVSEQLGAILGRLQGSDAPQAADERPDGLDEVTRLRRDLDGARAILRALTEQLEAMREAGASAEQLQPLEQELAGLGTRVQELSQRVDEVETQSAADATDEPTGEGLDAMLRRDRAMAARFDARVTEVRSRMVGAANDAALRALRQLRSDLGGYLRRSRIGRIDAVMGSKRRIEIQIESLAAGRFPPELQDPLSVQGLLRDDEEYWPFEGEYWADEFEEDPALVEEIDEAEEAELDEPPVEGEGEGDE
ncbi:MAG TPA: tetratricopeptide repeat protein [Sandaracinaceae bacterium LLY-WYZ-13_1]|nr:tetratricopeptide repeat protein [Sandaracinaceae bacterium LLY-WYZ-13_1]